MRRICTVFPCLSLADHRFLILRLLVHKYKTGLFGFDKMGPENMPSLQIHYWNGIHKALTKLGAKVVVAGVPR